MWTKCATHKNRKCVRILLYKKHGDNVGLNINILLTLIFWQVLIINVSSIRGGIVYQYCKK